MDLHPQHILSLCAGAGGLDLGLRLAMPTARTVCYVEIEAYACEILASRMAEGRLDDAPVWSNLKTFNGASWRGLVDGIVGGYPCQPFSAAGRRLGADDPRHLWPYIARIIRQIRPRWCFFENVANHLNIGFLEVARELEAMGYNVAATLWTAAEVGLPHKRERLFILAYRKGGDRRLLLQQRGPYEAGAESGGSGPRFPVGHATQFGWRDRVAAFTVSNGTVGDSDFQSRAVGVAHSKPDAFPAAWPPSPADQAGWQAILAEQPDLAPAIESGFRRVADGLAPRVDRLRLLGNGVVPQQAAAAFNELRDALGLNDVLS